MICQKCGQALPEDSLFCQYCGCNIQNDDEATKAVHEQINKKRHSSSPVKVVFILLVCFSVISCVGNAVFWIKYKDLRIENTMQEETIEALQQENIRISDDLEISNRREVILKDNNNALEQYYGYYQEISAFGISDLCSRYDDYANMHAGSNAFVLKKGETESISITVKRGQEDIYLRTLSYDVCEAEWSQEWQNNVINILITAKEEGIGEIEVYKGTDHVEWFRILVIVVQ